MAEFTISTLADLPFHVSGRFPKPVLVRRCTANAYDSYASREFFDAVRDASLGLATLGVKPGDRVALLSESRPEWLMAMTRSRSMTGRALMSLSALSGVNCEVRVSESLQACRPLSVRRAISSPDENGTTTRLRSTAGLAPPKTPASSSIPGLYHNS